MSQHDVEVLDRFLNLFQKGEVEAARAMIHPDIVLREAASLPYPGDFKGREGFDQLFGVLLANLEMIVDGWELFDAGDRVIGRMHTTLVSRHSGEQLPMIIVEIHTIRDDMLADVDIYYKDTKAVIDLYNSGRQSVGASA
jgi:uncharacterized protein